MKNMNTLCILLTIVLVALIIYAIINKGKLWGGEKYRYYQTTMTTPTTRVGTVVTTPPPPTVVTTPPPPPPVPCTGSCSTCYKWNTANCSCVQDPTTRYCRDMFN